jgi:hypothetical protein
MYFSWLFKVASPTRVLDSKTYWLTDRPNFDLKDKTMDNVQNCVRVDILMYHRDNTQIFQMQEWAAISI